MKIQPTGDRILGIVGPLTIFGDKQSPIVLPDQAKEKRLSQVTILDVGPEAVAKVGESAVEHFKRTDIEGDEREYPPLKKGDVVLVNMFAGTRVRYRDDEGEVELIIAPSREILAVVDYEIEEGS